MVKRAAIALAGVLVFGLAPVVSAHASTDVPGTPTTVSKDESPIRNGPGWNYDLIVHADKGDRFVWECERIGSDWTSLWRYGQYQDGRTGWINITNLTDWDADAPYCD